MEKVLFFDGTCMMCNRLVCFVLAHDKNNEIKFATLQGKTAERLLPPSLKTNLETVVFVDQKGTHTQSTAILRMMAAMGGTWQLASALRIFPVFIRDRVYRYVARHRYHWFGTTESCALLTKEQKKRLLD